MKSVLIAVCGLAPQIITETVYALHQQQRLPQKVYVLTTREGRDACLARLFDGGNGAWPHMLENLHLTTEHISFTPENILEVRNNSGAGVDDIRTEEDNEAFVRLCMKLAWECSRDPHQTVYYSVAGGRKTMGAALSFAAQAYGRPQDRIFHVLVSPEFENNRDFYFPPTQPRDIILYDKNQQPYRKSTSYAQIDLVALPFFSFRNQLSQNILAEPYDPATLLADLVREEKPLLTVDLVQKKLIWKSRELDMRPTWLALYALIAEQKKDSPCNDDCPACQACWRSQSQLLDAQPQISHLYQTLEPGRDPVEMSTSGIISLTSENFNSYRSKINRKIATEFGAIDAPLLQISSHGIRPETCYGLRLNRNQLRIVR